MSFLRGVDGSAHNTAGNPARWVRPGGDKRRDTRSAGLTEATLACARCDAPVSTGGRSLSLGEQLACPFCDHRAPVRAFLSLERPTRPAHVILRVTFPG